MFWKQNYRKLLYATKSNSSLNSRNIIHIDYNVISENGNLTFKFPLISLNLFELIDFLSIEGFFGTITVR